MSTWEELSAAVERVVGGTRPNATTLSCEIGLEQRGRRQRVFIQREVVRPDLEFVHIRSAVGVVGPVDLPAAVERIGQLVIGGLGYLPHETGDGILSLDVKFPTALIDAAKMDTLLLLVQLVAQTADQLEAEFAAPGAPDWL
jgi:hypothetical protein